MRDGTVAFDSFPRPTEFSGAVGCFFTAYGTVHSCTVRACTSCI